MFRNTYEEDARARSYADVGIEGTYWLAFRDLPAIFERHIEGRGALDFGCGAGRSTRFLKRLGFRVVGVDIAESMLTHARERDPDGDYRLIPVDDLSELDGLSFDLVLSAFAFDNVPGRPRRLALLEKLRNLLAEGGRLVNVVSAAELYVNEWASLSTKDYPANRSARTGDVVQIRILGVPDTRPVDDVFWTDADYVDLHTCAGLEVLETHRPLGRADDPWPWVSETRVSPWAVYVTAPTDRAEAGT